MRIFSNNWSPHFILSTNHISSFAYRKLCLLWCKLGSTCPPVPLAEYWHLRRVLHHAIVGRPTPCLLLKMFNHNFHISYEEYFLLFFVWKKKPHHWIYFIWQWLDFVQLIGIFASFLSIDSFLKFMKDLFA